MILLQVDWNELFALETSLPELLVIGTVLYVGILILMRWMPRRTGRNKPDGYDMGVADY